MPPSSRRRLLLLVGLLLALTLLAAVPAAAAAPGHASGGGMTRQQRMEAKRAFDRAKHHPEINSGEDEELIEYTASDGTTKTMSRADLEARLREQQEDGGGLPQMGPDGALTKQKEGKASVAELREKDPFLAQVVDAAKYAFSRLQAEGAVAPGARLKSLHSIDDDEGLEENPKELHLLLAVAEGTEPERKFEVRLASSYLTEAWEVTGPNPTDKQPVTLTLRPPSSTSLWELALAHSPVPPSLLLMAAGLAVLLSGVLLVVMGAGGDGGGATNNKGPKDD